MSEIAALPTSSAPLHHATLQRPKKPAGVRLPSRQAVTQRPSHEALATNGLGALSLSMTGFSEPPKGNGAANGAANPSGKGREHSSAKKAPKSSRKRKGILRTFRGKSKAVGATEAMGVSAMDTSVVSDPGNVSAAENWPEHSKKLGHRQVDKHTGEVKYKHVKTSDLMSAIQMGVRQSVGKAAQRNQRDLLVQDFDEVESVFYPREGSTHTPAHRFEPFKFYAYAPVAFRHFRAQFGIDTSDFLLSLCSEPLRELSNPGASGSVFYLSHDDTFIIKTVQKGEHKFLRKLLPGYYMNLVQNKRTLLPKFFGLFSYQTVLGKNIRFVIMNNLLPSHLTFSQTYDLKGSTFGRKASDRELRKKRPTLKDLDFNGLHEAGLRMTPSTYDKLITTIRRDVRVLESFKIMDYSLLVGLHNTMEDSDMSSPMADDSSDDEKYPSAHERTLNKVTGKGISEAIHQRLSKSRHKHAPPTTLVLGGGSGPICAEIEGIYDRLSQTHGFPAFVQRSDAGRATPNRFLVYDKSKGKWCITKSQTDLTDSALSAFMKSNVPSPDIASATWRVKSPQTLQFEFDSGLKINLLRTREPADKEKDDQRSSLSFSTVSEQIGSELDGGSPAPPTLQHTLRPGTSSNSSLRRRRDDSTPYGGLVAYNAAGQKVILFLGIIDILQSYILKKKMEHTFKSIVYDGDAVSVHKPGFYAKRFKDYFTDHVFAQFDEEIKVNPNKATAVSPLRRPLARYASRTKARPLSTGDDPDEPTKARASPAAVRKLLSMPLEDDDEEEDGSDSMLQDADVPRIVIAESPAEGTHMEAAPPRQRIVQVAPMVAEDSEGSGKSSARVSPTPSSVQQAGRFVLETSTIEVVADQPVLEISGITALGEESILDDSTGPEPEGTSTPRRGNGPAAAAGDNANTSLAQALHGQAVDVSFSEAASGAQNRAVAAGAPTTTPPDVSLDSEASVVVTLDELSVDLEEMV